MHLNMIQQLFFHHHLKLLKAGSLITSRRDGKEVYYQAVRTRQAEALHAMTEQLVDIACPMPDKEGDSYE